MICFVRFVVVNFCVLVHGYFNAVCVRLQKLHFKL